MSFDMTHNNESIAKRLFLGEVSDHFLANFPKPSAEEQETLEMVMQSLNEFLGQHDESFKRFDREGAQSEDYIQALKELGLFGVIIGEEFGGLGLSSQGYARVIEELSSYDGSTALTVGAHSSIGIKGLLLFGNQEQKQRYLPKLATGEMVAAFCLTEPGAGSDAASIKTQAEKQPDGSWILNGEKIWITNGAFAEFFTVFARTDSGDEIKAGAKAGAKDGSGKISAFIVERNFSGVSTGPKEDKLGIRASATTSVRFDNVKIPAENLLGEEGKGFKIAVSILNHGRSGLGGGCVGAMKRAMRHAVAHAQNRKQFGTPIAEFGLIQEKIAQMMVQCFATESVVQLVAGMIDAGHADYSMESAMAKVYSTESLWFVANEALQIAGGNGFMKEYPYEIIVRDSRINMIFEGTNEILRLYSALTGLKEAGDYLKQVEQGATHFLQDPIKGFGLLTSYAAKKVGRLSPMASADLAWLIPDLSQEGQIFSVYTSRLAQATEAVLKRYGKNVIGQQLVQKRLADICSDLFVGLAVLARVSKLSTTCKGADRDALINIARIFTQQAKRRMQFNLRRLVANEDDAVKALAGYRLKMDRWAF